MAFTTAEAWPSFCSDVFRVDQQNVAGRLLVPQLLVKVPRIRQAAARTPRDLQFVGYLLRLPRFFRHHADEVFLDDHLYQARHARNRAFVDADHRGACGRRTHHAAVQHAWHPHIMNEFELSGYDFRDVRTLRRRSQHRPFAGRLALGFRIEREVKLLAADQLAVSYFLGGIALGADRSIGGRQLIHWDAKPLGRHSDKSFAGRGSRLSQIGVVEISGMRLAA